MIVYWAAAAQALLYLCAAPIYVCAVARAAPGGLGWGVGLSILSAARARRHAARAMERPRLKTRTSRRRPPTPAKPAARRIRAKIALIRAALCFVRHLRPRARLQGALGLGDAAATALVCGGLAALGAIPGLDVAVAPDFRANRFQADLSGMVCARPGQIIYAAARAAIHYAIGRIRSWKSIPLKT